MWYNTMSYQILHIIKILIFLTPSLNFGWCSATWQMDIWYGHKYHFNIKLTKTSLLISSSSTPSHPSLWFRQSTISMNPFAYFTLSSPSSPSRKHNMATVQVGGEFCLPRPRQRLFFPHPHPFDVGVEIPILIPTFNGCWFFRSHPPPPSL